MRFSISHQFDFDRLFWVPVRMLRSHFDQADLDNRFVASVTQGYIKAWFEDTSNGKSFIPPSVHLVAGRTQFIDGRHRTAVLEKHLEAIPVAFDFRSSGLSEWVTDLGLQPVNENSFIELPNLPDIG